MSGPPSWYGTPPGSGPAPGPQPPPHPGAQGAPQAGVQPSPQAGVQPSPQAGAPPASQPSLLPDGALPPPAAGSGHVLPALRAASPAPGPARRQLSLRARLVAVLVVMLVLALAASGYAVQHVLRGFLTGQVDDDLSGQLVRRAAYQAVTSARSGVPLQFPSEYVIHVSVPGEVTQTLVPAQRAQDDGSLPTWPDLTAEEVAERGGEPFTVASTRGRERWRAVAFVTEDGAQVMLALPLEGVRDAVTRVRLLLAGFGLAVTLVAALLGWLAVRRAFRPLAEVEDTAAAIAAGDLSRRIPQRSPATEVGRLTASLNGMLSQIERAFHAREESEARTRRFAADASHELRTPLAAIRGFAELYRQGAVREEADVARTMQRIEDEARRMGSLVEDLLLLARLDEQRPARHEPVDLAVLAADAVHDARGLDAARHVTLAGLQPGRGPAPAVVIGDENRLRQVVANLLGNAVRHTPPGTPVEVAVGTAGSAAIVEVRDHGAGLPPEHAARVFERFYRVDASRNRSRGGGSGLGLSIVAAVVAAHGGNVEVLGTPGGGATFRVTLPAGMPVEKLPKAPYTEGPQM